MNAKLNFYYWNFWFWSRENFGGQIPNISKIRNPNRNIRKKFSCILILDSENFMKTNVKVIMYLLILLLKRTDAKSQTEIHDQFCPFLEVFGHKWGNLSWSIKLWITVIHWYESNKFGFIKNCHIWPKMTGMPIFWLIGLTIFMGTQETIIYRLMVKKSKLFFGFDFLGHFWRGNGRGHHTAHAPLMVWGLQTRPKNWPTMY